MRRLQIAGRATPTGSGDPLRGVVGQAVTGDSPCADSSCTGFLVCQNFETATTGYDNSESWTESVGTNGIVEAADTTATVLRGSQQLKIYAGDSGQASSSYVQWSNADTVYFFFRFRSPDVTPSSEADIFRLAANGSSTIRAALAITTAGKLKLYHGTANAVGGTTLSNDTAYFIWGDYTIGTGSDGVANVYLATSVTKPASAEAAVTAGTSTSQVGRAYFRASYQSTWFYDQFLVDTSDIGDVCE